MPETFKEYPVMEIAISLVERPNLATGGQTICEGDIVGFRRRDENYDGIGMSEANVFLWILVEGLDYNEYGRFMDPVSEPIDDMGEFGRANDTEHLYTRYDKRRYCIPLDRLKTLMPELDLDKARDITQKHQPGLSIDEAGPHLYLLTAAQQPLSVFGLVYDKARTRYI